MNVNVPTCTYDQYKLKAPYDTDLQIAFDSEINSDFKARDDNNSCSICQKNMGQIGYSTDLYNCSNCIGFSSATGYTGNYPLLSKTWGCDTCETVVAPVSYYESKKNNTSEITLVSPDKLVQYLNDITYKAKVDMLWESATSCDKGSAVKNICINPSIPNFSITIPPQNQGPSNPQVGSSSGLSDKMIVLIIALILVFIFIVNVSYFLFRYKIDENFLRNYGFTRFRFMSDGFVVYSEVFLIIILLITYFAMN